MSSTSQFRTDRHRNPAAFTTQIAAQAGLVLGEDYEIGDSFTVGDKRYNTAKLLGDPIETTIKVIDRITFYSKSGGQRWVYIGIPTFLWNGLDRVTKTKVVSFMYQHEGGTEMKGLFI